MKVYTRTGDLGETSLFAGGRISKGHVRLHAYGTIDELNAVLGLVVAAGVSVHVQEAMIRVQSELFVVGSDLATPLDSANPNCERVVPNMVGRLEAEIDAWQEKLPALRSFILPGGGMTGAFLHQARTVCRRAERWVVHLAGTDDVNPELLKYVNRLSDWLFVAARLVNVEAGQPETLWRKAKD
jgi:cob(I)alamin adenosyltransferase